MVKSLKNRLGDSHFEVLPLYGALPTEEQNYALSPSKFTTKTESRSINADSGEFAHGSRCHHRRRLGFSKSAEIRPQ